MATDATGTPTSKGIPKFNTANDAPSGLGSNAQMDAIDALFDSYVPKPSGIATGEVPVWNGTSFVRSSVTNIGASSLGTGYAPSKLAQESAASGNVLTWNGSIWAPAAPAAAGAEKYNISTTAVDVVNTVTETEVYSFTLTGGDMGTNGVLEVYVLGDFLHNASAGSDMTARFKLGGSTVMSSAPDLSSDDATMNANRKPMYHKFTVTNLGSASSQFVHGHSMMDDVRFDAGTGGANGTTIKMQNAHYHGVGTASANTASNVTVSVTFQWAAASASKSAKKFVAFAILAP